MLRALYSKCLDVKYPLISVSIKFYHNKSQGWTGLPLRCFTIVLSLFSICCYVEDSHGIRDRKFRDTWYTISFTSFPGCHSRKSDFMYSYIPVIFSLITYFIYPWIKRWESRKICTYTINHNTMSDTYLQRSEKSKGL